MLMVLHKNARITPAMRAEIAASNESASVLAQRFRITVYKWKNRDVFGDRSHTAHHLQTVLTPAQETVTVQDQPAPESEVPLKLASTKNPCIESQKVTTRYHAYSWRRRTHLLA